MLKHLQVTGAVVSFCWVSLSITCNQISECSNQMTVLNALYAYFCSHIGGRKKASKGKKEECSRHRMESITTTLVQLDGAAKKLIMWQIKLLNSQNVFSHKIPKARTLALQSCAWYEAECSINKSFKL